MSRTIRDAITDQVGAEDIAKADSPSTKMALALAATGKHVYEGTVPQHVIAARRAKNKAARKARRASR
jgi:hypothetical protein